MIADILDDSSKPYQSPKDIFHEASIDDLKILHKMISRLQEKEETEVAAEWNLKKIVLFDIPIYLRYVINLDPDEVNKSN